MAKSRTCFSSALCCSEEFESRSIPARLLYYQVNFETNIVGEVVGARRIARGYGFSDDDFDELVASGLLVEVDGRCFVRHHFLHNGLANQAQRTAAEKAFSELPTALAFEGERFKSAYCLVDSEFPTDGLTIGNDSPNVSLTVATKLKGNQSNGEANGNRIKSNETENENRTAARGEGAANIAGEAGKVTTAPCPVCSTPYPVFPEGVALHGECPAHGDFFVNPETGGEYLEGIV